MIILAEIDAAIDADGTVQTLYVASGPYSTKLGDTPPNRNFVSCMTDPGSLGVSVYRNGRTGGYGDLEIGQIKLANAAGDFDPWLEYGFDGRRVVLRLYQANTPYASMPILFTGTIEGPPEVSRKDLLLRLKDKQQVLEVPACPTTYGGTNVLPAGVDGVTTDLKGKRLPRLYGTCLNITPDCVNTSKEIYRVNDGAVTAISAVYIKGASITPGADYATNALLQAAAVTVGTYATCLAEGLFRLNTAIDGLITADVTQGATSANRTAAQIIRSIALLAGLDPAEISASDVATLDLAQPATVGIYVTGETTARDAINQVAESVGAYAVFDTPGTLRVGRLSEPEGAPVLTLTDSQAFSLERQSQKDGDVPLSSVTLNHTKNWTVQESDVAGSVTLARRAFLKAERRSTAPAADVSILLKNLLAPEAAYDSLIVDEANIVGGPADLEAKRQFALYKVRRDLYEVTVHTDILAKLVVPSLMSLVMLQTNRYGLEAGKLFWLLGFRLELKRSRATFLVWG